MRYCLSICSCVLLLASWLNAGDIVINEIHYEPLDKTTKQEFVELYNQGAETVDVSGWFFSQGIDLVFEPGTTIAAGEYAIIVENRNEFSRENPGRDILAVYEGKLSNNGERLILRNADGFIEDKVDYNIGTPWPVAAAGEGSSLELLHPSIDNDLGGSWRPSGLVERSPMERVYFLRRAGVWRYRKALSEPPANWRDEDFVEDDTWSSGQTSIGFDDDDDNTILDDMRENYSGIYLRKTFEIAKGQTIPSLMMLSHFADDGFVAWVNGVEIIRQSVDDGDLAFDATASRSAEARWIDVSIASGSGYLKHGTNTIAIHAVNRTITSGDFSIDVELFSAGDEDLDPELLGFPTPGAQNSVFQANPPPQIRQARSAPEQPPAGEPFLIAARVTDPDGVASVQCHYQIVPPGEYIPAYLPIAHGSLLSNPAQDHEPNPEFENPDNWVTIAMRDDGAGGDTVAADGNYAAIIPPQVNRTLVRYRISATDTAGQSVRIPIADDPRLNHATFVYDGVPEYRVPQLSIHPEGRGHVYPKEVMESLAVYTMISRGADIRQCVAASSSAQIPQGNNARFVFNWEAAFVYRGKVHDHVRYRLRGANGRYQVPPNTPGGSSGKRHWRIKFNKGHLVQLHDRFGKAYPTRWKTINTGRMFGNRIDGSWGLGDQVNDIIWNAYGLPAPFGHAFHFRVVDDDDEVPADSNGQYNGDFWGIARAFENYDSRFLRAHDLPKGNLYKLVNQTTNGLDQQRYQAPDAVTTGADHNNIEGGLNSAKDSAWLNAYVDYGAWYRYHAIVQAIRHYDYWPSANKNATWYFYPDYRSENRFFGRMWTLPFDTDATWGPNWNGGEDRPFDAIRNKPDFLIAYRNHVREIRDLLWQRDQLEQVIRQTASFMDALEEPDIDRWRNAPAAAGRQYFSAANQRNLEGKIRDMLNFAFVGGNWPGGNVGAGGRAAFLDSFAGRDSRNIPAKPTITYVGSAGLPSDDLRFSCSEFEDPQGANDFAGMEWRLAEVSLIPDAGSVPLSDSVWKEEPVHLELTPLWESGLLAQFIETITVPESAVVTDHFYRVRARMVDKAGIKSHWSDPIEFRVGNPSEVSAHELGLRVTEVMYNPLADDGFEWIEIRNVGNTTLPLALVQFSDGIEFSFADSPFRNLGPGEYAVVASDTTVFRKLHPDESIPLAGQYSGNLANGGERIELRYGAGNVIQAFEFSDLWHPTTDGLGFSLVIRDARAATETWNSADSWKPSSVRHGTPGAPEGDIEAGLILAGDAQGDGGRNIGDAVTVLRILFQGSDDRLPCGDGDLRDPGNTMLLDVNGDQGVDLSDAVHLLSYLFLGGGPPALGAECVAIETCPETCQL